MLVTALTSNNLTSATDHSTTKRPLCTSYEPKNEEMYSNKQKKQTSATHNTISSADSTQPTKTKDEQVSNLIGTDPSKKEATPFFNDVR